MVERKSVLLRLDPAVQACIMARTACQVVMAVPAIRDRNTTAAAVSSPL